MLIEKKIEKENSQEQISRITFTNDNNYSLSFYNYGGYINSINIPYKNNTFIQTTIGQLNFFKWALENNVINYIEDNYALIEQDMNDSYKYYKKSNIKKRHTISSNNVCIVNKFFL